MTYAAPIRQIRFALGSIAGVHRLYEHPAFPDFNDEIVSVLLEEAGRFANEVIAPLNRVGDREGAVIENGRVRLATGFAEAYRAFVAAGWGGVTGPTAYGGQGLPHVIGLAVQEMWHGACMSFGLCPLLSQGAIEALTAHGSEQQRAMYLPKLVSGEWSGTMNLTEPQAGSDVGALTARALAAGDGSYRIQGTKIYITWGEHEAADNIIHLVLARLPDAPPGTRGISLFLVPKFLLNGDGSPGARNDVRCVGLEHKLGIHASPTCVMAYGDGGGATGFLIGAPNKGMSAMFTMMNSARLGIGMQGVGIAERSFQQALAFAHERRQGKPFGLQHELREMSHIISHADVRRMLLAQKSLIEAGRAICLANAIAIDLARHADSESARAAAKAREELLTPISKAWSTDMAVEVTSLGIQVHGGMGYIEETGAAQHFRDARIAPIYEGTNGIQSIDLIGRKLLLEGGSAIQSLLDEIFSVARRCADGPPVLQSIGAEILVAHAACVQATTWLQSEMRRSPQSALPGSTPYLRMLGLLCGAHFLAQGALSAVRLREEAGADAAFFDTRIGVTQFFAEQILPTAAGLLGPITRGAGGPFSLSGEDLGR